MAAKRMIRSVRNIITHQSDDKEEPCAGRVEKLLKRGNYPGLSSDVILEAPCFQLRENGEVERHVFLGVTKTEFVMATQVLPDYVKFPSVKYRANIDLDLEGMELVCSSPLEYIRFFMTDTSSRKFAVCTSLGSVWYFEMCNTADGSDDQWTKWREMIAEQDNPHSFGYKTWMVSKEDALDARKTAFRIEIEGEMGSLKFIKRPLNFCAVDNVGVQLTSLESGKPGTDDDGSYTLTPTTRTKNHVPLSEAYSSFLKIEAHFLLPDISKLKVNPKFPSSQSATEQADDICEQSMQGRRCPPVRRSQSDCVLGMASTSFSSRSSLHYKFSILSFIGEALPEEPHRAVDIVAIRFPQWGLGRTTLNQLHKIWKLRNEERLSRERESLLDLSDSDESITDIIEEYSKAKTVKTPRVRWKSAIKAKTEVDQRPTLEDLMKTVVFKVCGADKYKDKLWLYGATPADFAAQLTQIHIDLFKKVTELDIINFFHKHDQASHSSLLDLLSFSGGTSLLVVKEILMSRKQSQQTQRLKFFMQVCKVCHENRDLQSTWSVLTGLRLLPMDRLKTTWSIIAGEFPAIMRDYIHISKIFSHIASPKYTETLQNCSQRRPYLLWLNHFLWHMQYSLQRSLEDTRSKQNQHIKNVQKKHNLSMVVGRLFGKKTGSLDVPVKLKQIIRKDRQGVLTGGGWKSFHKESFGGRTLGLNEQDVSRTGDHHTLNLTPVTPAIANLADKLSSQIITHALDELCHNNVRAKKTVSGDDRRKDACPAKDVDSGKPVHPGQVFPSPHLLQDVQPVLNMPDIQVSSYTPSTNEDIPSQSVETRNSESYKHTDIPSDMDQKSSHVVQKKDHAPGTDRKSSPLVRISTPLNDDKVPQSKLPIKDNGNRKNMRGQHDGSRRKSLFETGFDDDEVLKQKETAIDDAIQAQLKQTRSGSLFQTWAEEEEEQQQQLDVDNGGGTAQRKTSFFGSLFSDNKSSNSSSTLPTESREKIKVGSKQGHESSHHADNKTKRGTASCLKKRMDGESDQRRSKSVRFQSSPVLYPYEDSVELSKADDDADDENTNWSSSSHQWTTTITGHHTGLHLKDIDPNKQTDTMCNMDTNLLEENMNWSSSSRQKSFIKLCCVCKRTGCILSSCGLERLVELQVACLSYHLKSNSKLYAYIEKESRNPSLNEILKTTVSNLQ